MYAVAGAADRIRRLRPGMRVRVTELPGLVTDDMHVLNETIQVSRNDEKRYFVYGHDVKGDAVFSIHLPDRISGATWTGDDSADYPALLCLPPFDVRHAPSGRMFTFKFTGILGVLGTTLTVVSPTGREHRFTTTRLSRFLTKAESMQVCFHRTFPPQALQSAVLL